MAAQELRGGRRDVLVRRQAQIAFTWETGDAESPDDGVRVLDTTRGGDPIALSRLVVPSKPPSPGSYGYSVISADGAAVRTITVTDRNLRVSELSVTTGRHVRDLHRATGRPKGVCRTPAVRHLLLFGERSVTVLDTITGNTVEHRYSAHVDLSETTC